MAVDGALERTGDGWALRFVREYGCDVAELWAAFVDPARRRTWFPDTVSGDFHTVGADLRFTTGIVSVPSFTGRVLAVETQRLLEFTWGEDVLRFEFETTASGSRLTLVDSISEQGKAARDGAGWQVCLEQLDAEVDGRSAPAPDRWSVIHPAYVRSFGPAASTVGVPE